MGVYAIGLPGAQAHWLQSTVPPMIAPGQVALAWTGTDTPRSMISDDGTSIVPFVPSLKEAKAAKWNAALLIRNARQEGGCTTALGKVDTDADSQRKISGAVLAAVIAKGAGQPFAIEWTMHDNSTVAHDADEMIAMGMAVTMFIAACQAHGTLIRIAIEGATDAQALAGIDIESGYPTDDTVIVGPS